MWILFLVIVEYPVKSIAKGSNITVSDVGSTKDINETSTDTIGKYESSTDAVSKYISKLLSGREKEKEDIGRRRRHP